MSDKTKKYKCSECGGTNLLWSAYIDEFDNIQEGSISSDTWCDDCQNSVSTEEASDE